MADTNIPQQGISPAVEAIPTPVPATPEIAKPDPRLEAFARKERQLRKMQMELSAEKQAMQKKLAEYETGYIPKARLQEDWLSTLNEVGIDYAKISEQLLNAPNMNDPATRALMSKLRSIEEKQAAQERAAKESQETQYAQAINQMRKDITIMVDGNEEYEMIKSTGAVDAVVELIEQTFQKEGFIMDIDDAAKQVETYLLEEAEKMFRLKKVQAKYGQKTEQQKPVEQPKQPQANQLKTLTNARTTVHSTGKTGEKERIARAMAAFKGELK